MTSTDCFTPDLFDGQGLLFIAIMFGPPYNSDTTLNRLRFRVTPAAKAWKGSQMSTRCTIKDDRDEGAGEGFHLYEDLEDESGCVMLDLEGFTFEASVFFRPSGKPKMRVSVRVPTLCSVAGESLDVIGMHRGKAPKDRVDFADVLA
jgi:hypothetical protein